MKCIKCGSEVSMWATVCPHCRRHPGGILDRLVVSFIRWIFIFGLIIGGIVSLFSGNSSNKSTQPIIKQPIEVQKQSTQPVKKQPIKVQEQSTQPVTQAEKINQSEVNNAEYDKLKMEEEQQTTEEDITNIFDNNVNNSTVKQVRPGIDVLR